MRCAIVIPARMAATRFPGKPLIDLHGKPMVQWVYEAARRAEIADKVLVATPDHEILERVQAFGGEAILTRADHPTGTDRLAEVARIVRAEVYVNVQGDEPLIQPESICACANPMLEDASVEMASVYAECPENEVEDPSVVKVVTDDLGYALYFSRFPIPYPRNERVIPVKKHVGLYAYRGELLERFSTWSMHPLEKAESLEQLRFMGHGVRIKMSAAESTAVAVDLPEHAETVRAILGYS
jgi:3-deoxy-D-manno-octulosonate cytidylyltransferase